MWAGKKRSVRSHTLCGWRQTRREFQQVNHIWAYVRGPKGEYQKQHPVWAGQGRSFRSHALRGWGKTLSCGKQVVNGHMGAGKGRLSETMPHVGKARQRVQQVCHIRAYVCRGKGGGSVTMPRASGALHRVPASVPYVIYGRNTRFSQESQCIAKHSVAE